MTQNQKVLKWLRKKPIHSIQAITKLSITRLAARVFDLQGMGYVIEHKPVRYKDTILTQYTLKG